MIVDVVKEQKGVVESSSVFKLGFILFCEITRCKLS